jgi:hypothetical protein
MRLVKVTSLVLMAVFMLSAVAAEAASAETLPEFTKELEFEGTTGKGELGLTGANVKCESSNILGHKPENKKLGLMFMHFKGCSLGGKECHSLGDEANITLLHIVWHLVRLLKSPNEHAAIWLLVLNTHVECTFLKTLVLLQGSLLGLIEPVNTKTAKYTINLNVKEGKQEFTKFVDDAGKEVEAKLEGSVNEGAFKSATKSLENNKITTLAGATEGMGGKEEANEIVFK